MGAPERLVVTVERLAVEGEGLARAQGSTRVVFVPHGIPGDRLEVEVTQAKSSFARARLLRLLSPSAERVEPACPLHFAPGRSGPSCGGCDWQELGYEAQLRHKRELVLDCLRRIAKLPEVPVEPTLASPRPWGYRNKVQIPFGRTAAGKPVAGFYETGSHRIVDFNACPVQPELSVRLALKLKELAARFQWPIYDEDRRSGWLRHLFARTNAKGQVLAALVTTSDAFPKREETARQLQADFPELIGFWQNIQPQKTSVILGQRWRHLWGQRQIEEKIGPYSFLVSPGAFLQVNTEAAAFLYNAAAGALEQGGRRFPLALDLYCGAGTLTLWAARAADRVIGVEENREAVRDAWKNAERNGVKNVRFAIGRVEAVLPRLRRELGQDTAVLVDPPRSGLGGAALRALTQRCVRRLVYVSCNPATFARDAAYLCRSGFRLESVQPVDLFPQTSHVELVARLDRH
ncbi:MAG: 23S rRNA (uracil(1939)-C(5))-methyltransferase RlmD [Elusimicrobia bacterium]|nr:23S rRNA (uracil(1939)-C(5))-methyltransferase RlmD [Elusimicrobiota bacterium]MDE2236427.1 23S rRNA (uracil(1939)-C(5))-methyltransferase RlmD [Elusimicrobiota bacterium]MDE2426069.1 23S rRNA (uracil(1939)-C(5))-methyltransferase RlmD [Elusimicrobiota bacterium]